MNFCGIVCEFNPFHNGHEYIIQEAKKQTGSEIVCLMSGDFVQRGTPAFLDKHTRAKHAIHAGANAVLELPVIYATSNAENFALGAIKIFKALGIKQIAFGIESTTLETLKQVAKLKFENSNRFQTAFKNEIENGINYNTALKRSIAKTLCDDSILEVLNKPNNILAIEYLTAILKLDADISPVAIERCDNGYNSTDSKEQFASASAIRELVKTGKNVQPFVPKYAQLENILLESENKIYESLVIFNLRKNSAKTLETFYDYNEGIEYRIKEMSNKHSTLEEITNAITTPRYRVSRVNKLLLYPLLKITKKVITLASKTKPAVRVLAISKSNKELLKLAPKSKISLVVTNTDSNKLSKAQKQIFDLDTNASNIYAIVKSQPNNLDKKIGTMFL